MNCLTYLLDLWRKGERFKILYNGDHVIGYNEKDFFDYGNHNYKDKKAFSPIESWHTKETIIKIFELTETDKETIKDYWINNE